MNTWQTVETVQKEICRLRGSDFVPSPPGLKAGVALNVRDGIFPLHGLRHPPIGNTCGWYIWSGGEMSRDNEFFQPLHVEHLQNWRPEILPYLGLPPGWRFLIAPDHEDTWFDPDLIVV